MNKILIILKNDLNIYIYQGVAGAPNFFDLTEGTFGSSTQFKSHFVKF